MALVVDRGGFVYLGRSIGSPIVKVGFTTRRDPDSYIRRRYAGMMELENLIAVSDAPNAERLCHFRLKAFRYMSFNSRELFVDTPSPDEIQKLFQWAATLVNHPTELREYATIHNILLEGDSHRRVRPKHEPFDHED
jgi:hypothetical protein